MVGRTVIPTLSLLLVSGLPAGPGPATAEPGASARQFVESWNAWAVLHQQPESWLTVSREDIAGWKASRKAFHHLEQEMARNGY
jgi:hypothetical protein